MKRTLRFRWNLWIWSNLLPTVFLKQIFSIEYFYSFRFHVDCVSFDRSISFLLENHWKTSWRDFSWGIVDSWELWWTSTMIIEKIRRNLSSLFSTSFWKLPLLFFSRRLAIMILVLNRCFQWQNILLPSDCLYLEVYLLSIPIWETHL